MPSSKAEKQTSEAYINTTDEPRITSINTPPPGSFTGKEEIDHDFEYEPARVTGPQGNANILFRVASRLSTRSLPEPPPPPDGGLKAWIQCAMTFLVIFNTWGYVNSFGTFQTYYESSLGETASTVSWIGSVQTFVLFFLGTFSGRASDAGFFIPLFAVGSVIQVIGIFMTSLSYKYWQLFLAQGIMTGIGSGIIFTPAVGVLSTYFCRKRGIAIALATTGNSLGGALYPLMVQQMLPKLGFGWTMRVLGFINLACFSVVLAFMRPRLPPRKSGPLVDWSAFREFEFCLHALGLCFHVAMLYWSNYYVSICTTCLKLQSSLSPSHPHAHSSLSDGILRSPNSWSFVLQVYCSPYYPEWSWYTRTSRCRFIGRSLSRSAQHVHSIAGYGNRYGILLDCGCKPDILIRLRLLLRTCLGGIPESATHKYCQHGEGYQQNRDETR